MGKPHTLPLEEHGAWDKNRSASSTRKVNSRGLKIGVKFSEGEINEVWENWRRFLGR